MIKKYSLPAVAICRAPEKSLLSSCLLLFRDLGGKMRRILLAGASLMAITAASADAETWTYNYTGSIQTFAVPTTGTYNIIANGAQGGSSKDNVGAGGLGAQVSGNFTLNAGELLQIAVGGAGASTGSISFAGGGGGGSFVYDTTTALALLIAGGGGGGLFEFPGSPGLATTGGSGGGGGVSSYGGAGGGGGFNGNGANAYFWYNAQAQGGGGGGFPNLTGGSSPSAAGGWGGGGGAYGNGGGGGGGFTGGNGAYSGPGYGGNSVNNGTNPSGVNGFHSGNGQVILSMEGLGSTDPIRVPEPAAMTLLGAGLAGLAGLRARRQA
jgi:hypothetical protein